MTPTSYSVFMMEYHTKERRNKASVVGQFCQCQKKIRKPVGLQTHNELCTVGLEYLVRVAHAHPLLTAACCAMQDVNM